MHWKGIIFLGVLIALFVVIGILFSDTWLENKIENTGTSLNGARVDIDDLEFSITELFIRWNRLQITDPKNTMMNRIETGKCEFDLEFLPLLSKKLIVESFTITDIRTNTGRTEDGAIEKDEESGEPSFIQKTADYLEKEVSSVVSPQFSSLKKKANVDSILKILDLQSITKISNLQKDIETKYATWEKTFSELEVENDLEKVESQIKSIDINNIKTADQYYAATKKVDEIYKTIKSTSKNLTEVEKNLSIDLKNIKGRILQVDDWVKEDYSRALSLAKIPDINAENISKMIFGERVVNQITTYLDYIATARKYTSGFDSGKPEKESPPRLKGQDIYFYNQNARPDFWIRKLNLTGQTENNILLSGLINNIVSDQRQIGKITDIAIEGKNEHGVRLALNGSLDYLSEEPAENFNLQYSGFSLADYQISRSKLIPNKIESGTGSVQSKLGLKGDQIEGEVSFTGKKLRFDMSGSDRGLNEIEEIIQSVIKSISTIDISAKVRGTGDNLHFSINSNLDDVLMNKMGSIVNERFEKAKKEITQRVDYEIDKYRAELDKLVTEKEKLLQTEMDKYERMLEKEKNRADGKKKEIEEIYEKEKSKIEDKIKSLF
ncbi:MAG: TIGR03545 family protein [Calditrichia bacterium]|nr:TIGR03545 family protein [Calditrichia bacterium]